MSSVIANDCVITMMNVETALLLAGKLVNLGMYYVPSQQKAVLKQFIFK